MGKVRESGMPEESYWDSFFDAAGMLSQLGCTSRTGDVVEFGCGYGTFTIPAAEMVAGTVHALDIDPAMTAIVDSKARRQRLSNIVCEVRDFVTDGSGLPDGTADLALLFNILHIEDPVALLREARRTLSPAGRVAIVHWRNDVHTPRGPSLAIRPSQVQCRQWGEAAGLTFERFDPLSCCAWHWGLVMSRPAIRQS